MASPSPDQLKWLQKFSAHVPAAAKQDAGEDVDPDAGNGEQAESESESANDAPSGQSAPLPGPVDLLGKSREILQRQMMSESAAADKARGELEKWLKKEGDRLTNVKLPAIMVEVRKKFPDAVKLLAKKELLDLVTTAGGTGARLRGIVNEGALATEKIIAAYLTDLPPEVEVSFTGGVITLSKEGAAGKVTTAGGTTVEGQVSADKGAGISLSGKAYTIEVKNENLKTFDPKLRATWQEISTEASLLAELKVDLDKLEASFKQSGQGGSVDASLKVDFEKKQAEFKLRCEKLNQRVDATITATTTGFTATLDALRKGAKGADAKLHAELEADFKELSAKFKAHGSNGDVKGALELSASAEKVTAKLEVQALRSGTVVTASFEKGLDEVKAAIDVLVKQGGVKITAELKAKEEQIRGKLKVVRDNKDLKLAAELEASLKELKGKIEAEIKRGPVKGSVGVTGSTDGGVGGEAKVSIALGNGIGFVSGGSNLNFAARVDNKGYSFGVSFSIGDPPDLDAVKSLVSTVDQGVQDVYALASKPDIQSIDDLKKAGEALSAALKPVSAQVGKIKPLDKQKFAAALGVSVEGNWPQGGVAAPPKFMVGLTIKF